MTNQEIFDKALNGILKQGVPSMNSMGLCKYRGPNGTMCAVGLFVTDDEAEVMDADPGMCAIKDLPYAVVPDRLRPHLDLLADLQWAHDNAAGRTPFVEEYKLRMRDVAKNWNLKMEGV